MRQIIFDTETTGMNFKAADKSEGHRIIELGCVELLDRVPTGNHLHLYFNPEQEVEAQAVEVHGLDNAFLADKPRFADCLPEIEAYLDGADELIAHNASFDVSFLNRELAYAGRDYRIADKFKVVDTLILAKQTLNLARNNLDALCKHYGIDNSNRTLHGALLDSELLLEVYLRLTGGQKALFAEKNTSAKPQPAVAPASGSWLPARNTEAERAAHEAILQDIRK